MAQKLLLDTDIGSDIDDAVALAYLLAQSECDLLGITTVTGETHQRAALADLICAEAHRGEIPVLSGLRDPLGNGPGQPLVPQFEPVAYRIRQRDFGAADGSDAIEFMAQTIESNRGEVTLLAVGPLTNVATLLERYPNAAVDLKRIVLMCGSFGSVPGVELPEREWNAMCDPMATERVFRDVPPGKLLSVGLDVTLRCKLAADRCRIDFSGLGPVFQTVLDMAEIWFSGAAHITFHDPLAAAMLFQPELCETAAGEVTVVADSEELAGATRFRHDPAGPHEVCIGVDSERFFEHYFSVAARSGR